ncbi:ribosomal RNA processing protein 36 homolog [Aricia agestis]|uniref:ribosomal RNA processing protein 36 homolog n=1 Tax=Aricia agestis TaxID=91739 RepID=UPI001C2066A0|nr:ribosomal RNA processing protein 36 homolog [Aricia agestis]XP_041969164.1 ribosomal RNA processing protein 36 homolog [Aricia agestis]
MSTGEVSSDHEDDERLAIKSEISSLSFEDLQKLKEKIGAKVYKEVVFGKNYSSPKVKTFKRENKNRPREMSSKKPVPFMRDVLPAIKRKEIRDPRFDPLCGSFDKKEFTENYNFLSEIRSNDVKAIKAELKETTDPEKQQKLKRLLQRLKEQQRTTTKEKIETDKKSSYRHSVEETYSQGKQPHFKNKSERRVESLVEQYEQLKKEGTGRIQRHLKRRQQKIKKRSQKAPTAL